MSAGGHFPLPSLGVTFRCRWQASRDARTLILRTEAGAIEVTLIECYPYPADTDRGRQAREFLDSLLDGEPLTCWLPATRIESGLHGRLWIQTTGVAEMMIRHGYAYETRQEMEAAL